LVVGVFGKKKKKKKHKSGRETKYAPTEQKRAGEGRNVPRKGGPVKGSSSRSPVESRARKENVKQNGKELF